MLQMPHFLSIIKGVKFDILSIILMLLLRTVEWVSFISIISILCAVLVTLGNDLRANNMENFLIQTAKPKEYLLKPLIILSIGYSFFFVLVEGFCVPCVNYYLKEKLVEIAKNQLINSIQPKNVIPYGNWNFTTLNRISSEDMEGVLLNKEKDPMATILIGRMHFDNKRALHLSLYDGVGKVQDAKYSFNIRFKKGRFAGPSSIVHVHKTKRNLNLFEISEISEFFRRFHLAIVILFMPFFSYMMLFGASAQLILCCCAFLYMLFQAIEIMPFNIYLFFALGLAVYLFYKRKVTRRQCS